MKYPIYNDKAYKILSLTDAILNFFIHSKGGEVLPPRSILISQIAHLGDLILTTSLLQPLKKHFPDLRIGVLVGSWAKKVIEDHPLIDYFHLFDHWKNNRSSNKKFSQHWKTRKRALQEIKNVRYDIAIDCSFHYPNAAPLLWRAKIPTRIGFESAGLSAFLTHTLPWQPENKSAADSYYSLLQFFLPHQKKTILIPHLTNPPPSMEKKGIVIHMGSGNRKKEWPQENWKKLVEQLSKEGHTILFTGEGKSENERIEQVINNNPSCVNLCSRLSWLEFTALIKEAPLLISVDSSAAHVAAAFQTPVLTLFTGIHPPKLWKPIGQKVYQISAPVPCSPCFKGCEEMACVREIRVEWVYATAKSMLGK